MAIVITAYVMIVMRGDKPERKGATVLMREDNSSAVQWMIYCKGRGKEEVRAGALMRILRTLKAQGGWFP